MYDVCKNKPLHLFIPRRVMYNRGILKSLASECGCVRVGGCVRDYVSTLVAPKKCVLRLAVVPGVLHMIYWDSV